MPKIAVATNSVTLPGISTARSGTPGRLCAIPPSSVRMIRHIARPAAPQIMSFRLPTTSMESQAKVIMRKYEI
jgi:hypothetical protein